jgi:hypothetical protein
LADSHLQRDIAEAIGDSAASKAALTSAGLAEHRRGNAGLLQVVPTYLDHDAHGGMNSGPEADVARDLDIVAGRRDRRSVNDPRFDVGPGHSIRLARKHRTKDLIDVSADPVHHRGVRDRGIDVDAQVKRELPWLGLRHLSLVGR